MIRCTIGVFAHNEEHNVHRAVYALLAQHLSNVEIVEIIVLASGCTDSTVEVADAVARANPIVKVVAETARSGKATAVAHLLSVARGDVIVFAGADTLPAPNSLERLLEPFADASVGMTGARVVPLNLPTTFLGFAVQLLWHVHHQLALRKAKLGELVACRNVGIHNFPNSTSTDDLALEALITARGYRLVYTPDAVVYNYGPESLREFLQQRRRVFTGEMRIALRYRYLCSSLQVRYVLPLVLHALRSYPRFLVWTIGIIGLEGWARCLGAFDALRGRESAVWSPAITTKKVAHRVDAVTLVSIRWPPGAVDSGRLLFELSRLPERVGAVCWWDRRDGEILVRVRVEGDGAGGIERRIERRIERATAAKLPNKSAEPPIVSYRTVTFSPPVSSVVD